MLALTKPIDDAAVVRAVEGDRAALEAVLRALEPDLRRGVSIQPLWSRDLDVDDVLQVSWLEAFLRIGSLRDHTVAGLRGWLQRVVQNNLLDAIRALERDKRPDPRERLTHAPGGDSARTLFGRLAGEHPTAGGKLAEAEQVERMLAAVSRLPASYRRVVEEVDLAERPTAEVAVEMGRSRGAINLLRRRAHDRLAELLGEAVDS